MHIYIYIYIYIYIKTLMYVDSIMKKFNNMFYILQQLIYIDMSPLIRWTSVVISFKYTYITMSLKTLIKLRRMLHRNMNLN